MGKIRYEMLGTKGIAASFAGPLSAVLLFVFGWSLTLMVLNVPIAAASCRLGGSEAGDVVSGVHLQRFWLRALL